MAATARLNSQSRNSPLATSTTVVVRSVALRLFAKEGYQAVSLRQIAENTGIQVGSLYNHIDGKQDLLFEFIYDHERSLLAAVDEEVKVWVSFRDKLKGFVGAYLSCAVMNRELHTLSVRERYCLTAEQAGFVQGLKTAQANILRNIIESGVAGRQFVVADIDIAVVAIRGLLDGMVSDTETAKEEVSALISWVQDLAAKTLSKY